MTPVLPPPGWSIFSAPLPRESDLAAVNDRVNRRINGTEADAEKPWRIIYGDEAYTERDGACHDYSITKRSELLGLGWPPERLLLAEVMYQRTQYHLVLVAVMPDGRELELDNMRPDIVPWAECGYPLVRRQNAANPGGPWEK